MAGEGIAQGRSDIILRASLDPTGVVVGSKKAAAAVGVLGTSTKKVAATAAPLSDKMFTLGSSMTMMAGSSNGANQAMMLSVNAMKLMDDAMRGVLIGSTVLIASIPVLITLLVTWYNSTTDVTDALKEQVDAINGSVAALLKLRDEQSEFSKSAGRLVDKLRILKAEQIATAEAALRVAQAETLASSTKWSLVNALTALVDPQTANLLLQWRVTGASREHTAAVQEQLIALANLKGEQTDLTDTINEYDTSNKNAFLSASQLSTLGAGEFKAFSFRDFSSSLIPDMEDPITATFERVRLRWKKMSDDMAEQTKKSTDRISITITGGLMQAFEAGEAGFAAMIKTWIKQLITSGLLKLIANIFSGGGASSLPLGIPTPLADIPVGVSSGGVIPQIGIEQQQSQAVASASTIPISNVFVPIPVSASDIIPQMGTDARQIQAAIPASPIPLPDVPVPVLSGGVIPQMGTDARQSQAGIPASPNVFNSEAPNFTEGNTTNATTNQNVFTGGTRNFNEGDTSNNITINNYGMDIMDINKQLEDLAGRRESRLRLA